MTDATNDLIYEVLKDVQGRMTRMEHSLRELTLGQVSIRQDIHGLEGHILRHDANFVQVKERLDRIEKRLGLIDA